MMTRLNPNRAEVLANRAQSNTAAIAAAITPSSASAAASAASAVEPAASGLAAPAAAATIATTSAISTATVIAIATSTVHVVAIKTTVTPHIVLMAASPHRVLVDVTPTARDCSITWRHMDYSETDECPRKAEERKQKKIARRAFRSLDLPQARPSASNEALLPPKALGVKGFLEGFIRAIAEETGGHKTETRPKTGIAANSCSPCLRSNRPAPLPRWQRTGAPVEADVETS
mmetsp:Transcript_5817/g.17402  ORF Transcript_5817/g.17402 Transcript_5817/m.17402 type:complete len:232 (+) Transcript_5817:442-1137(+)